MRFDLIALFPQIFDALNYGVIGRAKQSGLIALHTWNPRDYSELAHQSVDDRPYGGGPGMVMAFKPLAKALKAAQQVNGKGPVIYLSPAGKQLDHQLALSLCSHQRIFLIAGRYEGIDQRFIDLYVDEMISIGDYVLSGGEIPALVLIDAVTRLIPGVLGHQDSADQDAFSQGLLDWPHYTRPVTIENKAVPAILLSGDHQAIHDWRLQQALGLTERHKPQWFSHYQMNPKEESLLQKYHEAKKEKDNKENKS